MSDDLLDALDPLSITVEQFSEKVGIIKLREYQKRVMNAVVDSIFKQLGHDFVIMFPRQSGKNELQAHLEAYLLYSLQAQTAEMVKVCPTWRPQSQSAMRRLERVLEANLATRGQWIKEQGYIYRLGEARILFFSGAPTANIVGATASTLLEIDEAQSVQVAKYDRDIAPMAASTNATRVFWGTAWTADSLLGRELRAARREEGPGDKQRAFVVTADTVAAEVPTYGKYVAQQVARLGRDNPFIRTQYYSEEIDAEGSMFPASRQALMQGEHAMLTTPRPGQVYALLVDVAGEDETGPITGEMTNKRRDSTALTVVEVDISGLEDLLLRAPRYRVVARKEWLGTRHSQLAGELQAQAELWRAQKLVIDATGVGAGLASFLERALPGRVVQFLFNSASKSKLGWDFIGLVESGRFKDYAPGADELQRRFWRQVQMCESLALPNNGRTLQWGVPDSRRDPLTGDTIHDDLLLSAALTAVLDRQPWVPHVPTRPTVVIRAADPLKEMDRCY